MVVDGREDAAAHPASPRELAASPAPASPRAAPAAADWTRTGAAPRPATLRERCAPIEMLVLDVDGVLTDGRIIYAEEETEVKAFHVRDGAGLAAWRGLGKRAALVTARTSRAVLRRAAELGLSPAVQGVEDKHAAFLGLVAKAGLQPSQACYVGDDLPDLPVLEACGLAVAVADACPEARAAAHYVTRAQGGQGAVREVIELILRCQGQWHRVVERFRGR